MKVQSQNFKRKTIVAVAVLAFVIGGLSSAIHAQSSATPEAAATDFYRWYLQQLNKNRDPRTQQRKKLTNYLSRDFARRVYAIPEDRYDADVFISAQDFDEEWEKSVSTSKASIRGNRASLRVTLGVFKNGRVSKGIGRHVLRLQMIRERGEWKINQIEDF